LHLLVLVIVFYLNWGQAVMSNETTIAKFQDVLVEDFLVMMPALTALMLRLVYAIAGEVADSELDFRPFVSPSIPDHIDTHRWNVDESERIPDDFSLFKVLVSVTTTDAKQCTNTVTQTRKGFAILHLFVFVS